MADAGLDGLITVATTAGRDRGLIVDAASTATEKTTIEGASTIELRIPDPDRTVQTSTTDPLTAPSVLTLIGSGREFMLAAAMKVGSSLILTFEDALVATLRAATDPLAFRPGMMVDGFVQVLATDSGVTVTTDPGASSLIETNSGRSLGNTTTSSWAELSSIAGQRGWRLFSDGTQVLLGSDSWLLARGTPTDAAEEQDPVHGIDFTLDPAQQFNTAILTVDTDDWSHDAGTVINLTEAGPANGLWLVHSWRRTLPAGGTSRVRLARPSASFGG